MLVNTIQMNPALLCQSAAQRGGIQQVIIPQENERDLVEIPKNIKQNLDIRPVRWIDEVLEIALADTPTPRPSDKDEDLETTESKEESADDVNDALRHH